MSLLRGLALLFLCSELSGVEKVPGEIASISPGDAGEAEYRKALALSSNDDKVRVTKPYIELMMKAAESGHAKARTNIGYAYATGEGLPRNPKEAVRWFRMAAAQGDLVAMDDLGYATLNGEGVEKSTQEAIKWYTQAAENGYGPSQVSLSDIFAGETKEANLALAIAWRRIAMLSEEYMKETPTLLALEKKADKGQLAEARASYAAIRKRMRQLRTPEGMTK